MVTYNAPEQKFESEPRKVVTAKTIPYLKVMLFLASGMAIIAALGYGWPYLMTKVCPTLDSFETAMTISMVVAIVGAMISSIGSLVKSFGKKSVAMTVFFYMAAISYGILISSVIMVAGATLEDGPAIVASAFGITALAMIGCGLVGMLSKSLYRIVGFVGVIGLCCALLSLINVLLLGSTTLAWVLDFVFFGFVLVVTALDFNNFKRMAASGLLNDTNNLTVYCAYTLMIDYVWILLKVLRYLIIFSNRNN